MKAKESTWHGEKDRLLQVCRPCPCGCDDRGGRPLESAILPGPMQQATASPSGLNLRKGSCG